MAPIFGTPNYDFLDEEKNYDSEEVRDVGLTQVTMWYLVVLLTLLVTWLLVFFCLRMLTLRQKTRSPQQRRAFAGQRTRASLSQSEPTIYVSPANLPPPPKYEAMAPPSYEEVVGIHYPQYQIPQVQPITQPITIALAQSSNSTDVGTTPVSSRSENVPSTVITVTTEETRSPPTVTTT